MTDQDDQGDLPTLSGDPVACQRMLRPWLAQQGDGKVLALVNRKGGAAGSARDLPPENCAKMNESF